MPWSLPERSSQATGDDRSQPWQAHATSQAKGCHVEAVHSARHGLSMGIPGAGKLLWKVVMLEVSYRVITNEGHSLASGENSEGCMCIQNGLYVHFT